MCVIFNFFPDNLTEKLSINNSEFVISRDDCENYTSTDYAHQPTTTTNLDDTTLCNER